MEIIKVKTIYYNDYKWQGQIKVLEALNTDESLFNSIKEMVNNLLIENPYINEDDED